MLTGINVENEDIKSVKHKGIYYLNFNSFTYAQLSTGVPFDSI